MNAEHLEGEVAMPVQNEYTCYHIVNDRNKKSNSNRLSELIGGELKVKSRDRKDEGMEWDALVGINVPLIIVLALLRQLVPELVHSNALGVWHSCQPVKKEMFKLQVEKIALEMR